MFQHYGDVLDNKLQLAIGIVGIVSGLCFHLLPRLPKIISIANHKTNPTVTEVESASFIHLMTGYFYIFIALYSVQSHDPLFLAFNLTGWLISYAYLAITDSLPKDKLVRQDVNNAYSIIVLFFVVYFAGIVSTIVKSRITNGVLVTIAFAIVCAVKLAFETRDVGPVWVLASSLVMILNGAIWGAYGVLVKDVFICVSSGIGCVAGLAGLVLLCVNKNGNNNSTVAPVGDNGDGIV